MKKNSALLNPQLEAFMAVAKHQTVHSGARAICISQTAMTQRIQSLEQKLQTTLFVRTRQGMQLTAEGEKLLRYCHTVTHFSQETLSNILSAGMDTIQRVTLSGPSSIMMSRIIPIGMSVMKQFPNLYITFNVDDTDLAIAQLRRGFSQFAILEPQQLSNDLQSKDLAPEHYVLVCSAHWQHRSTEDILQNERIIDFDESDHMSLNYLKHFDLLTLIKPDRLFVNRTESLSKMLIAGFGYGVLTKEFSKPFLDNGSLITLNKGKSFDNHLKLAWYERPEPPDYFLTLLNAIV